MIEVADFTKIYSLSRRQMRQRNETASRKVAVDGISFTAEEGQIFGLLGPNGAGKTTTLRTMATLLAPTEGSIRVQGFDTVREATQVRRRIGFLTSDLKLDPHFTASYTIGYFGRLHGMAPEAIEERQRELFDYFGIREFAGKKVSELSTGMMQKLSIAVSLVHDPEVVIFDEPTNGLDIVTAKSVTDYLLQLRERGKLVVISTHIMRVAEKLCDRIAIILDGRIAKEGTLQELLDDLHAEDLEDAFFKLHAGRKEGASC